MSSRVGTSFVALVLAAAFALAQGSWSEHNRNGEWAFARGDYARAEQEFKAALSMAQGFPEGDVRLETSLGNLARFYEHRMQKDLAQPLYQLLLAAQEARLGDDSPALLDTLAAIGRVAVSAGDVPTSIDAFEHYDRIAVAAGEPDPVQHGRVLQLLARSYTLQERADEALAMQRRAVALIDAPTADDLEIANAMESLAQMELMDGTADNAEQMIMRAVALREAAGEAGNAALALATAAETALAGTNFEAAERLAEKALSMVKDPTDDGGASLSARSVLADLAWLKVRRGSSSIGDLLAVASDSPELDAAEERLTSLYELLSDEAPSADGRRQAANRLVQVNAMQGDAAGAMHWLDIEAELAADGGGRPESEILAEQVELAMAAGDREAAAAANARLIASIEARHGAVDPRLLEPLERQQQLLKELKRRNELKAVKKRLKELNRALR